MVHGLSVDAEVDERIVKRVFLRAFVLYGTLIHSRVEESMKERTSASKLRSTSPSHGVFACDLAPPSMSIPSPNSNSGLFVLRSLYFATMLIPVLGVSDVQKPNRRCVEPLSMHNGVLASRWSS